jgi:arylsulfatase
VAPPTGARPFTVTAELELGSGQQGAIIARGGMNGGWVLYVKARRLAFHYNHFHATSHVESTVTLPEGRCTVGLKMARDGKAGTATLTLDGADVATLAIPAMAAMVSSTGMDVGRSMAPVCDDYLPPFAFEGRLHRVVVEIATRVPRDAAREVLAHERVTRGMQ